MTNFSMPFEEYILFIIFSLSSDFSKPQLRSNIFLTRKPYFQCWERAVPKAAHSKYNNAHANSPPSAAGHIAVCDCDVTGFRDGA
ncbi:hypothetical protein EVAR_37266_1 [Eumeta japonica]|uniref:Uncharacterized protein n=1 Tax=Eumeta variegata TaxID=151549 RepID=A0A4C1WKQ3_EUMVA|nr:hypothetical protein EVAR_37266_1 [Eumeta japonica]